MNNSLSCYNNRGKAIIFLILLVFLAYFNSLQNDFVSDDISGILKNKEIDEISYLLSPPLTFLSRIFYFSITNVFGRVPIFYRAINIFFHLGTVLMSYILLTHLIDPQTAFFAASILAVHPVQTEAVTWISGGPYAQYAFFIIVAFWLYLLSIKNGVPPGLKPVVPSGTESRPIFIRGLKAAVLGRRDKKFFFVSLFSFALAIFSSEKAAVLPMILLLFVLSFLEFKKNWKDLIPFFVISVIWGILYLGKIGQRISAIEAMSYEQTRLLNPFIQIPIAITSYLELIFWPKNLTIYHSEMTFNLVQYFIRLTFFIIFLGIIAYSYKRNRQAFFWLCFFFITLLPTLTPFGISWIVAERYVYLGSLGIFVVVALIFRRLGMIPKLRLGINIIFFLILSLLLLRTIMRNNDWKNEDNLWIATAKTSPSSPVTHNNLGDVYSRHGDLEKAIEEFKKAIAINPRYADAYHNLATTYLSMNNLEEATENYQRAISLNQNLWQSYQNLAAIYFKQRKYNLAKEILIAAMNIVSNQPNLHANLGLVYYRLDDKEKAKKEFEEALSLDPGNKIAVEALLNLH